MREDYVRMVKVTGSDWKTKLICVGVGCLQCLLGLYDIIHNFPYLLF